MPNLHTSFIFTDEELYFLLQSLCDAKQCNELCGLLFVERELLQKNGEASLKKKRLLDANGRIEPVVFYLFQQIASAEQMYQDDDQAVLNCQEIIIRFDRYHHAAGMYRLTPQRKIQDMEESKNGESSH